MRISTDPPNQVIQFEVYKFPDHLISFPTPIQNVWPLLPSWPPMQAWTLVGTPATSKCRHPARPASQPRASPDSLTLTFYCLSRELRLPHDFVFPRTRSRHATANIATSPLSFGCIVAMFRQLRHWVVIKFIVALYLHSYLHSIHYMVYWKWFVRFF